MALFQKGVSGNPGGRPKIKVDMRERVRVHAGAAIDTLLTVMHDDKAPPATTTVRTSLIAFTESPDEAPGGARLRHPVVPGGLAPAAEPCLSPPGGR